MLATTAPHEVGMDARQLERAFRVLERYREQGAFPGYVAGVARHGRVVALRAAGLAQVEPARPATVDTRFDMASVTKVMATLPAVLALADDGLVSLDEPVYYLMPEFDRPDKRPITVRQLLSHSAGLPGWRPTYVDCMGPDAAIPYMAGLPLEYEPGTDVQYTCLGFIVLGELVRRVSGLTLDRYVRERIYLPLGMDQTGFGPVDPAGVAATEQGNQYEAEMVARAGLHFPRWRTGVIAGEVNDGNAYYTMGGVSGNAGLFATAADAVRYGLAWLGGGEWGGARVLSAAAVEVATRQHTPGLPQGRGLGWIFHRAEPPARAEFLAAPSSRAYFPPERYEAYAPPRAGGDYLRPGAYGHTGFTGTSLWLDPQRDLVMVLLTNRTHPVVRSEIAWARPRFHNAVVAACRS